LGPAETALRAHEEVLGPNHRAHRVGDPRLITSPASRGLECGWTKDTACVTAEALDAVGRADQAAALRARYGVERDRENQ
jgi:hypothetical protein